MENNPLTNKPLMYFQSPNCNYKSIPFGGLADKSNLQVDCNRNAYFLKKATNKIILHTSSFSKFYKGERLNRWQLVKSFDQLFMLDYLLLMYLPLKQWLEDQVVDGLKSTYSFHLTPNII